MSRPTAEGWATFAIVGNQLQEDGTFRHCRKPTTEGCAHSAAVETNRRRMHTFCRCGNQLQKDAHILPLWTPTAEGCLHFAVPGNRTAEESALLQLVHVRYQELLGAAIWLFRSIIQPAHLEDLIETK